jgi:hypothetical protein
VLDFSIVSGAVADVTMRGEFSAAVPVTERKLARGNFTSTALPTLLLANG